ncbi:MAG TPA: hypothetical protein VEW93_04250 [Acidimicrobiales bacterium]|nr:hypothetical protein [Acidimicrobiales bacterium]
MARFEVTLRDRTVECVGHADAYQQEGPMTTFFRTDGRDTVDSWSTRVASVRTAEVLLIRRADEAAGGDQVGVAALRSA